MRLGIYQATNLVAVLTIRVSPVTADARAMQEDVANQNRMGLAYFLSLHLNRNPHDALSAAWVGKRTNQNGSQRFSNAASKTGDSLARVRTIESPTFPEPP